MSSPGRSVVRIAVVTLSLGLAWFSATAQEPGKAADKPEAKPGEAAPAEPPKTGDFEFQDTGVNGELYMTVIERYGEPAYAPLYAKLSASLGDFKRTAKLKAKAQARQDPKNPAPEKKEEPKKDPPKDPIKWGVYVPKEYDGTVPYGIVSFVNSQDTPYVPDQYKASCDKCRLIWVSPSISGNDHDTLWRMTAGLDGIRRLAEEKKYKLDPDRIYVSGTSGGAHVASNIALHHPDVVTGGIFFAGINYFRGPPSTAGIDFPGDYPALAPDILAMAKGRRQVLLFGKKDTVATYVPAYPRMFVADGFKYFAYLEVPELGHDMPTAEWFEKSVVLLDSPLKSAAKGHFDAAQTAVKRDGLGKALQGYTKAFLHGGEEPFTAEAKKGMIELKGKYDEATAAIEKMIDAGETKGLSAELAKFRKTWEPVGNDESKRLAEKQKAALLKKK